ncbi:MAG: glycosyltransferase [Bacteroidetes bacterium]|nr:glycosyltransferase [Bacteroidota bacterium]
MLKLLIVGSDRVDAIENFYYKYLKLQGVDVRLLPAYSQFCEYYYASNWNKLLFRLHLSNIYSRINQTFKEQVESFRPDVIWIFKGMEIYPNSIKWAKAKGIRIVSYNPDNPFVFTGRGSGNRNVTRSIGLYDLHFTYNLAIKRQLEEQYKARTALLPFGYDIDKELLAQLDKQPEINKACFLGNPDRQRAAFIGALAEAGVSMDIYGRHWDKFLNHPGITIHGPAYGDEMWKILKSYRIQLNLMRIHNEDSHNMRTFEVPGIGGIMLAPDTTEHRLFFEEGKEVFLYREVLDCVEKIEYLQEMSAVEVAAIRYKARKRSLDSGYSYEDRAKQALGHIRTLMGLPNK